MTLLDALIEYLRATYRGDRMAAMCVSMGGMVISAQTLTGSCHCGDVRYECATPVAEPAICHCTSCRRTIGAHAAAWMSVSRTSFRLLQGTLREYASSDGVVRGFCGRCGCSVSYTHRKYPDEIDITLATLDDANAILPTAHIWMSNAMSWDRPGDGLPQYAEWRKGALN